MASLETLPQTSLQISTARRLQNLQRAASSTKTQVIVKAYCAQNLVDWVNDWCWTYVPKNPAQGLPAYVPFDLFPKQTLYLNWLEDRVSRGEEGVCEKSRDVGITWLNCAFAVHRWLYYPGFMTAFGANKEENVDKIGDPGCIFEKMRLLISWMPQWMRPEGWSDRDHNHFMRLVNPENNNVIIGQVGDNMGRGGRSTVYFIDEAAHIDRPERVEAATVANADCRVWVSSVNGMGNLFAKKRHGGEIPVFTFHWSDDPRKNEVWEKTMRAKTEPHIFASEYDIDYAASVEGVCIPGKWVEAARKLKVVFDIKKTTGRAGLDVGGGKSKSVFIARFGPLVMEPESWTNPDTTETAYKALDAAKKYGVATLCFDSVGVGAGVQSTLSHAAEELYSVPVNVGERPTNLEWPDGSFSHEIFPNLKAELWWKMRDAFWRSYQHYLYLTTEDEGEEQDVNSLIILPNCPELSAQIPLVRWFRMSERKIRIERKDELAKRGIASPDFADALALTFHEPDIFDEAHMEVSGLY